MKKTRSAFGWKKRLLTEIQRSLHKISSTAHLDSEPILKAELPGHLFLLPVRFVKIFPVSALIIKSFSFFLL